MDRIKQLVLLIALSLSIISCEKYDNSYTQTYSYQMNVYIIKPPKNVDTVYVSSCDTIDQDIQIKGFALNICSIKNIQNYAYIKLATSSGKIVPAGIITSIKSTRGDKNTDELLSTTINSVVRQ